MSGIPGGAAMAATVPGDLVQYFAHVMRVEQKLAYLYGWQSFLNDEDEVDDETLMELILLMGIMMGVGGAASSITKFASNVATTGVTRTIQRQALTKTTFYPIMKKILRIVGVQLTKETFAKTAGKIVPVIGGVVSGGLTYASFKPGSERLRKYLRSLPSSGMADIPEEEREPSDFQVAMGKAAEKASDAASNASSQAKAAGSIFAKNIKTETQEGIVYSMPYIGNSINSLVEYIQNNTREEDKVLVYPEGLSINVMCNRDSDNKFL